MRIGVAGLSGRMGQLVAAAIAQSEAVLAGGTVGSQASRSGATVFPDILGLARSCDLIIDFTHASTIAAHAAAVREAGTAWVLGTTGLSQADQALVGQAAGQVAVVQAANFSPGVALVVALAARLAAALPASDYDAEILEMHHRGKRDAPSGTALALGEAVASARGMALADVAQASRRGETGARPLGTIGLASLRGGQVVGDHTVLFAGDSEHICLSHSARDRSVFARGALRAALWAGSGRRPGLYGMNDVLGLTEADIPG